MQPGLHSERSLKQWFIWAIIHIRVYFFFFLNLVLSNDALNLVDAFLPERLYILYVHDDIERNSDVKRLPFQHHITRH